MLPLDRSTFDSRVSASPESADERERALKLFESMAMPDPTSEEWRYVELDADFAEYSLASSAGDPAGGSLVRESLPEVSGEASIIDGFVGSVDGDGVALLSSVLGDRPGLVEGLGRIPSDLDRFAAAHAAFRGDAVVVHAPAGSNQDAPVFIDIAAASDGVVSLPKVIVIAEDGADVSVVIDQRSADGVNALVVPQVEVLAGAAARAHVTVSQAWGADTVSIAQHRLTAGRDAFVGLAEAGFGGRFSRLHLIVDLVGAGADARILGLSFGDEDQTLDYRYFMNHAAPHTTSEMFLKGAVADHARSVFTGMIRIQPEGQKTNAHQTNRNLVLSDGAEAHSVPNLEILANDVRCGHGSTMGPLDAEQRYYLMSRGLDRRRADRLQVKGFFEDVLRRFPVTSLQEPLRETAMAKYARFEVTS